MFELGELPMHLVREYKSTYMTQISIEKFLILKVKETEKESRLLRSQLAHTKTELKIAKQSDRNSGNHGKKTQKRKRGDTHPKTTIATEENSPPQGLEESLSKIE